MYYNRIENRFDYYVNVSTGSNNVYCNALFETSDERLKENIEDVDEDCSELVKKITVMLKLLIWKAMRKNKVI